MRIHMFFFPATCTHKSTMKLVVYNGCWYHITFIMYTVYYIRIRKDITLSSLMYGIGRYLGFDMIRGLSTCLSAAAADGWWVVWLTDILRFVWSPWKQIDVNLFNAKQSADRPSGSGRERHDVANKQYIMCKISWNCILYCYYCDMNFFCGI